MATALLPTGEHGPNIITHNGTSGQTDPFLDHEPDEQLQPTLSHQSSAPLTSEDDNYITSPAQAKRTLEAHLQETERRLRETQKLGTSLLEQQNELTERLKELEQQPDEPEVSGELRTRLVQLEKEHDDVGREIALRGARGRGRARDG
ncbi:MAG: hypothetical protein M1823_007697, partial [Watsoniomyces obsoletus]